MSVKLLEVTVKQYASLIGMDQTDAKKALEKMVRKGLMYKSSTYQWCPKGGWNNKGGYRMVNQYNEINQGNQYLKPVTPIKILSES